MSAGDRMLLGVVLDVLCDALSIMMALRLLRVRIRPVRVCFASVFGASAAYASRFARLSGAAVALLWLPVAALMMRLAGYGRRGAGHALRGGAALLGCTGFLGGMVCALYGVTGSYAAAYSLGGMGGAAVFVIVLRARRREQSARCVQVVCVIAGKRVQFEAMEDSGNTLQDYLTHCPVIVVPMEAINPMEKKQIRLRPIFAQTAGGRTMMALAKPEETMLCVNGWSRTVDAALAFSPGLHKGAPALVPSTLLEWIRDVAQ